jgi:DNA-directed RNA polymerase specialized sigma24 family protein
LKAFKGQSSIGTWLHRIGVNLCLNRVSMRKPIVEPIDAHQHVDTATESPHGARDALERAARVRAAIASVTGSVRRLFFRMYHELSHQQIAEILESTVGAVKANSFTRWGI